MHNRISSEKDSFIELPLDRGIASGSVTARYEQLSRQREERAISRFPRTGKFLARVIKEPQNVQSWHTGGVGERKIGKKLDNLGKKHGLEILHDRLIPGSRANIDHIAVTSIGIFVLDTKYYKGSIRVKYRGGLLSKRSAELWIGNRNQSKLVTGVQNQVNLVQRIVATGTVDIPVIGVLAFYRGNWEAFSFLHQEKVNDIFLNNRGIAPLVSKKGPFTAGEMSQVARLLAGSLPAPDRFLRAG
ncbi:MAG: NERD domain-containing protein [Actinobacteria bacterium]|nr:NERD domain-containing protein [Actinomycetota bacterium]